MPDNYFQTRSRPLATTLVSLGFKLEAADRSKKRIVFSFGRTEGLDEAVQAFWSRELKVDPVRLFISQTLIKSYFLSK
jgi:hypothetical protein